MHGAQRSCCSLQNIHPLPHLPKEKPRPCGTGLCAQTSLSTGSELAAIYLGVEPGTAGAAAAAVAAAAAAASAAALAASAAASTTAAAASEAGAAGSTAGTTTTAGASTAAGAGAGAASSFLPQAASAAAAIRAARTREFFISIFLFGQTSTWKAMASDFFELCNALAKFTWVALVGATRNYIVI